MSELIGPRDTAKHQMVRSLADYVIEAFSPQDGPIVLIWREVLHGYSAKMAPDAPNPWARECDAVFNHWNTYGRDVCRILKDRCRVTVVKVSRRILRKDEDTGASLKHGSVPNRDARRTDEWYRKVLPNGKQRTAGVVCFPRDAFQDHPLVVEYMARRGQASSSMVRNTVAQLDHAEGNGNLSLDRNVEIKGKIGLIVRDALADQHPLFAPKAIEQGPLPSEDS
jgi:hypothetical protein